MNEWLEKIKTFQKKDIKEEIKLPGDASTRSYYRICLKDKSYVLMKREPFEVEGSKLPFLVEQRFLKEINVDVPDVVEIHPKEGLILLEDLGDITLLHRLKKVTDPCVEYEVYQKIIDQLIVLQTNANKKLEHRFDYEKLMWEVDNTVDHFYVKHLKRNMSERCLGIIQEQFGKICKEIEKEPLIYCHRDFHSRNVMVTPSATKERLVFIDFQDARMGCRQYDLVSLLRDSYYQLDEEQVKSLVNYYIDKLQLVTRENIDREHFFRMFDLMTIQRNFKAIGSFASFYNNRGDALYLKYIGNTFENIRRALLRNREFHSLREVLTHYYYF